MTETTARPTAAQMDTLLRDYKAAQKKVVRAEVLLKGRKAKADELKQRILDLVKQFGGRHTEKSQRLEGLHGFAMATTGTRSVTVPEAIEELRVYLEKQKIPHLVDRFFVAHTTYSLVAGPTEVLKSLDLKDKMRTKITQLVALCFKVETNAPSLKVETVHPQKPERT